MLQVFNQPAYTVDEIKQITRDHLLIKGKRAGKINAAITRRSWFIASSFVKSVAAQAPEYTGFNAQLQSLLQDKPKCQCGASLKWYHSKFLKTCGAPTCYLPIISKNRVSTNRKKYGVGSSPLTRAKARARSPELQTKGRETIARRYGVNNVSQLQEVILKSKKTLLTRYGPNGWRGTSTAITDRKQQSHEYFAAKLPSIKLDKLEPGAIAPGCSHSALLATYTCNTCGFTETKSIGALIYREAKIDSACAACSGLIEHGSIEQAVIYNYIRSLGVDAISNDRQTIKPYEIDIYIPSKQLAIEYHGIFWHSSPRSISANVHLEKFNLCNAKGIRLLQFVSTQNLSTIKSVISHALGLDKKIGARTCQLITLSRTETIKYLNAWHLDKTTYAFSLALGLTFNGEVVQVATFGKSRFKRSEWELHRLASKPGLAIVGGVSKLVTGFQRRFPGIELISYQNNFLGGGRTYERAGFTKESSSRPNYWYWKSQTGEWLNRYSTQKHKLRHLLGDKFVPELTEQENMLAAGYRIFKDAGHVKYRLKS